MVSLLPLSLLPNRPERDQLGCELLPSPDGAPLRRAATKRGICFYPSARLGRFLCAAASVLVVAVEVPVQRCRGQAPAGLPTAARLSPAVAPQQQEVQEEDVSMLGRSVPWQLLSPNELLAALAQTLL